MDSDAASALATPYPLRAAVGRELSLWALMRSDIENARIAWGSAASRAFPNLFVTFTYRLAHALSTRRLAPVGHLLSMLCLVLTGAEIRPAAQIGAGLLVYHPVGIVIGSEVVVGENLVLWGANTLGHSPSHSGSEGGSPVIGNNVSLLAHSSVIGSVKVGDRAIVAAHALVLTDVPSLAIARGVPARMS